MTAKTLRATIAMAEKFLVAAKEVRIHISHDGDYEYISRTRESGACRRASMELTRSLADMRKP